jgi:tRNA nucleotidyltransferase (CCA-adding enzyme)
MDLPDLLEQLRTQPGGESLLAVAPPGAFLVGGAVRDLLLGRTPRELDVVLVGAGTGQEPAFARDVARFAGELAARLRTVGLAHVCGPNEHERFGTAIVKWTEGRIDVAAARRERYPTPGALPEVEPASLEEDLLRRDFTVNAIALALGGPNRGELQAAPWALDDLQAGVLRVLHERSFLDDPTRLWRLARYRTRLGFAVEERTASLAAAALAGGALGTVSGARLGAELRLALAEPDPSATLTELDELGALDALHPHLRFEPALARNALELLPADGDGRPDLLALTALVLPLVPMTIAFGGAVGESRPRRRLRSVEGEPRMEIAALLDTLEFPASDRDRVAAAAVAVPRMVNQLPVAACPSELRDAALGVPPEGVALAGAVDATAASPAQRWLRELRHVRLRIRGEDLLAVGVPEGPEIGRRLEQALRMRLDGELPDEREAQLNAALRA